MSALVVDLGTKKLVELDGAGATGFGKPKTVTLSAGYYEVRVIGGPSIVKLGHPPVARIDLVVVENAPLHMRASGEICLAAQTSTPARVYVSRLVDPRSGK